MDVTLRGSSPSAMTAGIMLLTRSRQLGYPLTVSIVGDPTDLRSISGPAVMYAPVLASCGVGRDLGSGAIVVIPGPRGERLYATATPHGVGGWFEVDRTGEGAHPGTQAFVRLSRDPRPKARQLAKDLRRLLVALGVTPDPAIFDVLFGAPLPPLLRLAIALRAGRSMAGGRGTSITRFLSGSIENTGDTLPEDLPIEELVRLFEAGELRWLLDRLSTALRDRFEDWLELALELSKEDDGRDLELLRSLIIVASNLCQLPVHSILPPLGAAEDSLAVGLQSAMLADGEGDPNAQLRQVYSFLGGRFVSEDDAMLVHDAPPPAADSGHIAHLEWFCGEVRIGRKRADALWEKIFNPVQ